jgi:hypothetical protein
MVHPWLCRLLAVGCIGPLFGTHAALTKPATSRRLRSRGVLDGGTHGQHRAGVAFGAPRLEVTVP